MRQNLVVPESGHGLDATVPGSLSGSSVLLMRADEAAPPPLNFLLLNFTTAVIFTSSRSCAHSIGRTFSYPESYYWVTR